MDGSLPFGPFIPIMKSIFSNETLVNQKFIMVLFFSALFLLSTVRISKSENLIIFDNIDYGPYAVGGEEKMVDHAVLAVDGKMDLPTSFTICSSVHMNFMTASIVFYQLYQDDGKPWFNLYIRAQRDMNKFQEKVELVYYKQLSQIKPTKDPVNIVP